MWAFPHRFEEKTRLRVNTSINITISNAETWYFRHVGNGIQVYTFDSVSVSGKSICTIASSNSIASSLSSSPIVIRKNFLFSILPGNNAIEANWVGKLSICVTNTLKTVTRSKPTLNAMTGKQSQPSYSHSLTLFTFFITNFPLHTYVFASSPCSMFFQ